MARSAALLAALICWGFLQAGATLAQASGPRPGADGGRAGLAAAPPGDRTGGRLADLSLQRQSEVASLRLRRVESSWAGTLASYGVAAGLVLLAVAAAARGRMALDVSMPLAAARGGGERRARGIVGLAFLATCASGLAMLHGPSRLPALIGGEPAAAIVAAAIVLHVISALILAIGAAAAVVMAARPAGGQRGGGSGKVTVLGEAAGRRLAGTLICVAVAVSVVTAFGLLAPLWFLPWARGAALTPWLDALRVWHVGAGVIALLLAAVSVSLATLAAGRPPAAASTRGEPSSR